MTAISREFARKAMRGQGMSEAQIRHELCEPVPKETGKAKTKRYGFGRRRNKYGAQTYRSPVLNRTFDSIAEGHYGEWLWARQEAGEIEGLVKGPGSGKGFQVRTPLIVNGVSLGINMYVDFKYYDLNLNGRLNVVGGEQWVWDEFKGFPTDQWKLKKRIFIAGGGPGLYRVTRAARNTAIPYPCDLHMPIGKEPVRKENDNG